MVIIQLRAGLANQMFQYAVYKQFKSIRDDVFIDDFSIKPDKRWDFEQVKITDVFANLNYDLCQISDAKKLYGGTSFFSKAERAFSKIFKPFYYNCSLKQGYNKNIFSNNNKNLYLTGGFQSEMFFFNVKDQIRNDFKFPELRDKRNLLLLEKLKNVNSVAIHVRKGKDYEKYITQNTCDVDYYVEAIKRIKEKVSNPEFFVFTDNKEWVINNFGFFNYEIVDWNPHAGKKNYIDMQIMSLAKHNIIANSTYSWWGAWLNNNPEKVCIGPHFWYNPMFIDKNKIKNLNIIPQNWIQI